METPPTGSLYVTDSRTGRKYEIPVEHNAIKAVDLNTISAPENDLDSEGRLEIGLRVLDPGYRYTAVKKSCITCVYVFLVIVE